MPTRRSVGRARAAVLQEVAHELLRPRRLPTHGREFCRVLAWLLRRHAPRVYELRGATWRWKWAWRAPATWKRIDAHQVDRPPLARPQPPQRSAEADARPSAQDMAGARAAYLVVRLAETLLPLNLRRLPDAIGSIAQRPDPALPAADCRNPVTREDRWLARFLYLVVRILAATFRLDLRRLEAALEPLTPIRRLPTVAETVDAETAILHTDIEASEGFRAREFEPGARPAAGVGFDESVVDLVESCKWAIERERERTDSVDGKATQFGALAGTVLSIVFGGIAVARSQGAQRFNDMERGLLTASILAMVLALFFAIRAVGVRGSWRGPEMREVFRTEFLADPHRYRALFATHLAKLWRAAKWTNDSKSADLTRCQWLITISVVVLGLLGIALAK